MNRRTEPAQKRFYECCNRRKRYRQEGRAWVERPCPNCAPEPEPPGKAKAA